MRDRTCAVLKHKITVGLWGVTNLVTHKDHIRHTLDFALDNCSPLLMWFTLLHILEL